MIAVIDKLAKVVSGRYDTAQRSAVFTSIPDSNLAPSYQQIRAFCHEAKTSRRIYLFPNVSEHARSHRATSASSQMQDLSTNARLNGPDATAQRVRSCDFHRFKLQQM